MDSINPESLPEDRTISLVSEEVAMEMIPVHVVEVMRQVSEGLHVGIESCEANGQPLSDLQKIEMTQCIFFCLRDLEREMKSSTRFSFNMFRQFNGNPEMTINPRQTWEDIQTPEKQMAQEIVDAHEAKAQEAAMKIAETLVDLADPQS